MSIPWTRSKLLVLGLACCALTAQCSGGDSAQPSGQPDPTAALAPMEAADSGTELAVLASAERAPAPARVSGESGSTGATAQPHTVQVPPGGIRLAGEDITTRELGQVREGESVETVFELISDGEWPLVIESVKTTCGCTVPGIEISGPRGELTPYEMGSPIPVGARLRLLAKVYTQGKTGRFSASIMLETNDPVGLFSVRVETEVEPVLECTPGRRISLGQMNANDQEMRVVRVHSHRGEAFLLRKDHVPPQVQLELSPISPDADGRASEWEVALDIGPGLPPGDINYSIQLTSDLEIQDPKDPRHDGSPQYHTVVLVVHKLGLIYAQPAFLGFGTIAPGGSVERTLQILTVDGSVFGPVEDMPIEVVSTDGRPFEFADYLTTTLRRVEDGGSLELSMKLENPPLEADRSFLCIVKVGVGHPEQAELSFNFTVTLKADAADGGGN